MATLREQINNDNKWGKTWNGCDTLNTTSSKCLDLFARAGSMRASEVSDKEQLFSQAYNELPEIALKLLFYIRDIREGYGERDTFRVMLRKLAYINPDAVKKNLWAMLEFGYAKDLYSLIGTQSEDDMWEFMKAQFEIDLARMEKGESISLLAKWIATPDATSDKTRNLGKLTAKKLGYSFKQMSEYKKKLRSLRKYLDLPEAKMCAGCWNEIEYAKCASRFLLKNRNSFIKHDNERWAEYLKSVNKGEQKMNTATLNPCDIIYEMRQRRGGQELETMWNSLKDVCKNNALVMCDTSSSMTMSYNNKSKLQPIDVAFGLALYFAQRNKGDLKNMMMNFSDSPMFIELDCATIADNYNKAMHSPVNYSSTNLEAAFELLLDTCKRGNIKQDDMPDAIIIVSDMQINCVDGVNASGNMTFYSEMKKRYNEAEYEMPHVVFWNVNAENPTFHASLSDNGVSLVSGFSPNVYKQVMESLDTTPFELMMNVVNSERYKEIHL